MSEHTVKQFDAELENIRGRVLQMGGAVEQQITRAMEAFSDGDLLKMEQVINYDGRVNLMEVELDEACSQIIARRQPAASDLRMIMTVIKIITDLERVGDEAKKVAKMARQIHTTDAGFVPRIELKHISTLAVELLRQALDCFARLDLALAAEVVRRDKEVDAEFKSVTRQLITFMMEDPRTISHSLEIIFISKAFERIGDHAKNICEYVVYMVKGRDVRHIGLAEIDKEIAD